MRHAKSLLLSAVFAAVLLGAAAPAQAAPFCVTQQDGRTSQCYYEDIDECRRDAARQDGYCTANVAELHNIPATGSNVCLIETSRAVRCLYVDLRSCQQDAARAEGVCFYKPAPRPAAKR